MCCVVLCVVVCWCVLVLMLVRLLLSGTAPPKSFSEVSSIPPVSTCGALVASLPRCALAKLFSLEIQKLTKFLRFLGKL